jgi:uncharacterized membrane protein YfcA
MYDLLNFVYLFLAGVAASFINAMAGGGSLITLGIMMLLGIEPSVANGTNRIGVVAGTGSAALAFKTEKYSDIKQSVLLSLCAIPGAIIGSLYSINLSDKLFQQIIAIIMILVLLTLFIQKNKQSKALQRLQNSKWIYPVMFVIGLYGGFIQIGVGFLLMAAYRHLMVLDLLKTNMHKNVVVLIYTIPILFIFGFNGKINWAYAIIISLGNAVGSWISVKIAIKKGEKFVKFILAISILLMAAKFIYASLS